MIFDMICTVKFVELKVNSDYFQYLKTSKNQDITKSAYFTMINMYATSCHNIKGLMATKNYIICIPVLLDLTFGKWCIYLSCENYDGKDFPS